jgi:uncharacterized protein
MQFKAGRLIYSPTDLTNYLDSPFATWMDRFAKEYPDKAPDTDPPDSLMSKLAEKGYLHEDNTEQAFRNQGLSVEKLSRDATFQDTFAAMQKGYDVIAQAKLEKDAFAGFADFLIKVPGPSLLGDYHYTVWDSKLSGSLKPAYAIQLCCYAEMLETQQGKRPEILTIVLGTDERSELKTVEHFAFYQSLKERFLDDQAAFNVDSRPDPADSKSWGNWSNYAELLLVDRDHLFQVATITRNQIKKLNIAGIQTAKQLAETKETFIKGISPEVLTRLKAQADIQIQSKDKQRPAYRVLPHENDKRLGLRLLPPHSASDVFFDIEGYPLIRGGLEYLWGATYFDEKDERQFRDFWAHDVEQEKAAFKAFITWIYERWLQDPSMHVYHYAQYEITACKKLMGRYGICEHEVDELLRNQVFVDLYKVVKGAILLGEPRYSIKNVEHLYREKRDTGVVSGGESVVGYDEWRSRYLIKKETGNWQDSEVLTDIRNYNIDDCNSTQELVVWLRNLQDKNKISYQPPPEKKPEEVNELLTEKTQLRDELLNRAVELKKSDPEFARLTENLAWFLEFHRRESKPIYWRMYDRLAQTDDMLVDDPDCIAYCVRNELEPFKDTPRARNLVYQYQFDASQDLKTIAESYFIHGLLNENGYPQSVTVSQENSNIEAGLIAIKFKEEPDSNLTLIPSENISTKVIEHALMAVIKDIANGQTDRYQAIFDFLTRCKPRFKMPVSGALVKASDSDKRLQETIALVKTLNNSYLTIQGPPGTGKSFTGSHIITALLTDGAKIGIASNSHKAILNLLKSTAKQCRKEGVHAYFACSKDAGEIEALNALEITVCDNTKLNDQITDNCVIGTTAWGFSRDDLVGEFDYLFVDEAGQVSVANLIAMSRCAKNLILLGDQMQLGQPTQGTHPAESGLSILDYLLHHEATIDEEQGIFLGTTFRMHPNVNAFISEQIYEGKLHSAPIAEKRQLLVPEGYYGPLNKTAGIVYIPVHHDSNTQASDEEVEAVVAIRNVLVGRMLTLEEGGQRKLTDADILYVAPYNHQVAKLRQALGKNAKVGSVDKFQGQEAPVVVLSMCASSGDESPRGMEFILDKNRLNVAISRAQTLAVVVASPSLINTSPNHIEQIPLINLMATLMSFRTPLVDLKNGT